MRKTHIQYACAKECADLAPDATSAWQLVLDYAHAGKIVADKAVASHEGDMYAGASSAFFMGILVALGALNPTTIHP